MKVAMKIISHA
jgi:hypothetical protein